MGHQQNFQLTGSPGARVSGVNQISGGDGGGPEPEPIRLLFLAANPEGTAALRLDQEVKAIGEALRSSRLGPRFELEQSWAVGDRELQDGLLRWRPDIVHLSGHGTRESGPILEEEGSFRDLGGSRRPAELRAEDPRTEALVRVFAAGRGRIRCVVLNACHTEATARALAQCVGCVVGMSQAVEDGAAIRFSWAFYNALGYGLSVKAAFDMATAQMSLMSGQGDVPRLLTAGVDPNGVTFG
jgi:hypothetical protein